MQFFQKRGSFLEHIISEGGAEVDPGKIRAVERMKEPSSLKDVRALLGLVGYNQKFILDFGKTAESLYNLSRTNLNGVQSAKVR